MAALGLAVPRDLAVIGYDNTYLAEIYNPGITSVNVPVKEMLAAASKLLFDKLAGRTIQKMRIEFNNELVVRESA
jgi:DNA-binding LacI/PurR family transcriptional regulator